MAEIAISSFTSIAVLDFEEGHADLTAAGKI